jgi:hypothetical protein
MSVVKVYTRDMVLITGPLSRQIGGMMEAAYDSLVTTLVLYAIRSAYVVNHNLHAKREFHANPVVTTLDPLCFCVIITNGV